jgi:alpha-1,6-mannosyltransferase
LKIVDITEFYSERGGGVRSHLTTRGHVLCQLGHDHAVVAPGPRDEEFDLEASNQAQSGGRGRTRVIRIAGPCLPYDRTYHLLGRFDKIRTKVLAERPDVLESHSPYLATVGVLASGKHAARVRTSFWHADHVGAYVRPAIAKHVGARAADAVGSLLWKSTRALLAPFDATFVAGVAQADQLRAAGVKNVVHCPFGVDVRVFCPAARSEARRRELLDGRAGPLLVGVGRFAIEKRWDVVLRAFGRVREGAHRNATLVLFGDGPERKRLECAAPPGVRFAGFEKDRARLASALASADVLVHGSPYETFGIGVAEAIASALPVVVPDAGGAAENVDTACGERYASLDDEACAGAIERVLDRVTHAPVELRESAHRAAARAPTLHDHFQRVLSAYADLLHARGSRP